MIAYYDKKPSKFEAVGNGSYLYRMNIESIQSEFMDKTYTQWKCEEFTVWSPITPNKITESVITEKWDSNYEQKLVNDYNSAIIGIIIDDADAKIQAYKQYLSDRKSVKEQIDKDCEDLGIFG